MKLIRKISTARRMILATVNSKPIVRVFKRNIGRLSVNPFHRAYYDSDSTWKMNHWHGFPIAQCPFDLQNYQEIIIRTKPDYIIQTGVFDGGSALFFAHMLDLMKAPASAVVVAVDIELRPKARELDHPRIHLLEGSSTDPKTLTAIKQIICKVPEKNGGMVSLDSDHRAAHVADELKIYPAFVGVGQYLIVEDCNVNNNPVLSEHGAGPLEATNEFLRDNTSFERDDTVWQRHLFSFHQRGWLRRIN